MEKFHIYIETSVWSFAFAEDVPDYQAETVRFFEPYVSRVVLSEIQRANAPLRERLEELIRDVKPVLLSTVPEADSLSEAFLRENVVPAGRPEDARHVAIAMVHSLAVPVSWNFRHRSMTQKPLWLSVQPMLPALLLCAGDINLPGERFG